MLLKTFFSHSLFQYQSVRKKLKYTYFVWAEAKHIEWLQAVLKFSNGMHFSYKFSFVFLFGLVHLWSLTFFIRIIIFDVLNFMNKIMVGLIMLFEFIYLQTIHIDLLFVMNWPSKLFKIWLRLNFSVFFSDQGKYFHSFTIVHLLIVSKYLACDITCSLNSPSGALIVCH